MIISIAQIPVTLSIERNLESIRAVIKSVKNTDIVIFPEAAISGYEPEKDNYIRNINFSTLRNAHMEIHDFAKANKINIVSGTVDKVGEQYYNATFIFTKDGRIEKYYKTNLALFDKEHFTAGDTMPIFEIGGVKIGIVMCREIRYPEIWRLLSMKGAKLLIHLNNALGQEKYNLWKSHLISRAGENQRYVFSVNNANEDQGCPTMAIDPDGNILEEVRSKEVVMKKIKVDLNRVRDYYLSQQRTDIVKIIEN
jgi:predicted amidohydrolase